MNLNRIKYLAGLAKSQYIAESKDENKTDDESIKGMEGPFVDKLTGKKVYFSEKLNKYYCPDTDKYYEKSEVEIKDGHNEVEDKKEKVNEADDFSDYKSVEKELERNSKENDTLSKPNKFKIPKNVISSIDKRIDELKDSIEKYDEKGYNDEGPKQVAITALEQIKNDLLKKTEEGFKEAQIYFSSLPSYIAYLIPASVVKFLANDPYTFDKAK